MKETSCEIEELNPFRISNKRDPHRFPQTSNIDFEGWYQWSCRRKLPTIDKVRLSYILSAGSGASFTLPVALDLLKVNKERDLVDDYLYRPQKDKDKDCDGN